MWERETEIAREEDEEQESKSESESETSRYAMPCGREGVVRE